MIEEIELAVSRLEKVNKAQEKEDEKIKIQDFTDALVIQCNELVKHLSWITNASGIGMKIPSDVLELCEKIEKDLNQRTTQNDHADWDKVVLSKGKKSLNELQVKLTKLWLDFFDDETKNIFGLLDLYGQIHQEEAKDSKRKLNNFKEFDAEMDMSRFREQLKKTIDLVDQFDIDDASIKEFLSRIRNNKATLDDINEPVKSWIRTNGLSGKIKVSF